MVSLVLVIAVAVGAPALALRERSLLITHRPYRNPYGGAPGATDQLR